MRLLKIKKNQTTTTKPEAKDVLQDINRTQAAETAEECRFVPGDLDLQTRPSEGPNTPFV